MTNKGIKSLWGYPLIDSKGRHAIDDVRSNLENNFQKKNDDTLTTTNKTISGAINEVNAQYKDITKQLKGINIEDFGAKGDGVTDDTKAIQNALDFASKYDKNVEFGNNKTYLISTNSKCYIMGGSSAQEFLYGIMIKGNVEIKGNSSTILFKPGNDGILGSGIIFESCSCNSNMTKIGKPQEVKIKNLIIDGGRTSINSTYNPNYSNTGEVQNGSGKGIFAYAYDYLNLETVNVSIKNCWAEGIYGNGDSYAYIKGGKFENCCPACLNLTGKYVKYESVEVISGTGDHNTCVEVFPRTIDNSFSTVLLENSIFTQKTNNNCISVTSNEPNPNNKCIIRNNIINNDFSTNSLYLNNINPLVYGNIFNSTDKDSCTSNNYAYIYIGSNTQNALIKNNKIYSYSPKRGILDLSTSSFGNENIIMQEKIKVKDDPIGCLSPNISYKIYVPVQFSTAENVITSLPVLQTPVYDEIELQLSDDNKHTITLKINPGEAYGTTGEAQTINDITVYGKNKIMIFNKNSTALKSSVFNADSNIIGLWEYRGNADKNVSGYLIFKNN